jgi:N-acetylmuramoyl-L-alanine amidase
VQALHAPTETDRPIVVAVDAGHGGQDPGAIGHGGTREKDVTLAIARALAQRINSEPGMRAVLTRNRDEFLVLGDRIHRAHLARADLFVSVHADSIRDESVAGASVYVLSDRGATDEAARWLADRENSADLVGGLSLENKNPQLKSVLIDLSQSATISSSMVAAERVLAALDSVGEVRKSRVQQAGFVVLKSRDIASMLVETAYISNPQEERRLRTSAQQEKLAGAIFSGIRTFFETNPPPGIRLAQLRRGLARVAPSGPSLP